MLSFLGWAPSRPTPSWGQDISYNQRYITNLMWWGSVGPGMAIFLAVFAFNFLGDALRDWLDPQFRRRARLLAAHHVRDAAARRGGAAQHAVGSRTTAVTWPWLHGPSTVTSWPRAASSSRTSAAMRDSARTPPGSAACG